MKNLHLTIYIICLLFFTKNVFSQENDPCENDVTPPTIEGFITDHALHHTDDCKFALTDYLALNLLTATDNCSSEEQIIISQSPAPNTIIFEDTEVAILFTDKEGNEASYTFIVMPFDNTDPVFNCLEDITIKIEEDQTYTLQDYTSHILPIEECSDYTITQTPQAGTQLEIGSHGIELIVEDSYGNATSCYFYLNLEAKLDIEAYDLQDVMFYPNPVKDILNISKPEEVESFKIYDNLGKEILSKENVISKTINVSELKNGVYQIVFKTKNKFYSQRFLIL
ncbi:T9SS type A sorting domain-containing protein [Aureivirga sp. CE67]|uniref:T9SS type A sorting domain-containing protein n=1 Tax=Aureivirga sp. CE67 TaxID=1788983 RepID=UPI0018CB8DA7|nr:T9SS type A sorting domain-containing protein [Aureivirga sp. CE67]